MNNKGSQHKRNRGISSLCFCIFSYNRGIFLENCVRSIEFCAPDSDICIFDDNSDDDETARILSYLSKKHLVEYAQITPQSKHGGLYALMQMALEKFKDRKLVCFLQDDMQLVRKIDLEDVEIYMNYFQNNDQAGFIQPCFLKGSSKKRYEASLRYKSDTKVYQHTKSDQSAGTYYSDISLFKPERLLSKGWSFKQTEPKNNELAQKHFDRLAYLYAPFAMWLPEVPTYRGKRKTLALRLAEKKRKCGFYPFRVLADIELETLKSRQPDTIPVAEDFLSPLHAHLEKPWRYYPLQGNRWLKKLNSFEVMIRRFFTG